MEDMETDLNNSKNNEYNAASIKVLEGLEAVRKRPAMYIGSTDGRGLNHLALEVIDNSVDEAMAGFCKNIVVTLEDKDILSVSDDGRGIPVDIHPELNISGVEVALTKLHAGGKFDEKSYKVSGGLHGVGVSVVNALSEWLVVEVKRDEKLYRQKFEKGVPVSPLETVDGADSVGTKITFKPDREIFETTYFDSEFLFNRLKELAFLNKGLRIIFKDKITNEEVEFYFCGGVNEYLNYLIDGKETVLPAPIYFSDESASPENKPVFVEISLNYTKEFGENILSFVNSINTKDGGTHVAGFKSGLVKTINEKALLLKYSKEEKKDLFSGEDVKDGLYAIINSRLFEPQFEGQTKGRLGNNFVKKIVEDIVYKNLSFFLDKNPDAAKAIIERCLLAKEAREAAAKARDIVRRKGFLTSTVLPGKLADCSEKDPNKAELFIVEGISAGGSAKQGRDKRTQAILPLRGKILNVEKANIDRILSNEEIKALIAAIGCGIERDFDYKKLRYKKIFIMADADVDGAHIRTLLLTFFYRYMRPLIENGNIFIAQPPLYLIKGDKKERYAYSDKELEDCLKEITGKVDVQRYKGLGEMSAEQLANTTMDAKSRVILNVTIEDAAQAEMIFSILMGEKVAPRKEFIKRHAHEVTNLDI